MPCQLRERLFERTDERSGYSILVLLDPNHPVASTHPLHLNRLANRPIAPEVTAVSRDDRLGDSDSHPRLLVLRSAKDRGYLDEELLALTMACAQQRKWSINGAYVCGWLITDAPPQDVASQIRRNLIIENTAACKRVVVPLFEPHRLMLASHLAPPQWLSRWLGCVSSWLLIDASGQLQELNPSVHDAGQPYTSPGPEFWSAQSRLKQARQVLLAMVKANQMIPAGCEMKIDRSLQIAHREGLKETEDIIFFATNHMVLPSKWYTHPAIRACIATAVNGEMPLTLSITSLPDEVLDELSLPNAGEVTQGTVPGRT